MAASGGFRIFGQLERAITVVLWCSEYCTVRAEWRQLAEARHG
jgi:hypothetical protein